MPCVFAYTNAPLWKPLAANDDALVSSGRAKLVVEHLHVLPLDRRGMTLALEQRHVISAKHAESHGHVDDVGAVHALTWVEVLDPPVGHLLTGDPNEIGNGALVVGRA